MLFVVDEPVWPSFFIVISLCSYTERLNVSFSELFVVLMSHVVLRVIICIFDSNVVSNEVVNSTHVINGVVNSAYVSVIGGRKRQLRGNLE